MGSVSYQLRAQYVGNYGGGTIAYGPYATSFDVGAALTAGGGTIVATDEALVHELDRYPPLYRSGFTGEPTPTIAPRFRALSSGNGLTAADVAYETRLNNEPYPRWQILGDGSEFVGSGSVPPTALPDPFAAERRFPYVAASDSQYGLVSLDTEDPIIAGINTTGLRQAFADARALDVPVLLPDGAIYSVNGRIHDATATTSKVKMFCPGRATIQRIADVPSVDVAGSRNASTALSANAAAGDQSFTTATLPAGLAAGDRVQIRSTTAQTTESNMAENARVLSITGSGPYTINLYGALEEAYTTAASAAIEKINFAGVGSFISGVTFRQTAVNRDTAPNPLVRFTLARDFQIDDFIGRDADAPALETRSCIDVKVIRPHYENLTDDLGNNRVGYGHNVADNCRNILVESPTGTRCRHIITTDSDPGLVNGAPRHIMVAFGDATGTTGGAWNTHKGGGDIVFAYCAEEGSKSTSFYIRSLRTTLIAPRAIRSAFNGIHYAEGECDNGEIVGGRVDGAGAGYVPLLITGRNVKVNGTLVENSPSGQPNIESQGVETKLINVHSRNPGTSFHYRHAASCGTANIISGGFWQATGTTALATIGASTTVHANDIQGVNLNGTGLAGGAAGTLVINGYMDIPSDGRLAKAADYTIFRTDPGVIGVTSTAAARTITLEAANNVPPGTRRTVKDESGGAGTNNITIQRAGTDTIDGATTKVINTNYGSATLYSDGVSKWFAI